MQAERRTVLLLIAWLWAVVKLVFLLRTGALESASALRDAFSGAAGVNQLLVVVVCGLLSYAVYWLLSLTRRQRLLIQVSTAGLCTIGFIVVLAAYNGLVGSLLPGGPSNSWSYVIEETAVRGWAPFALYSAAALALIKSTEERLKDARSAALEVEVREEHLRALRMQLDPHFMCNSLGAVSTLIATGRYDEANRMADRLAHFLRESAVSCGQREGLLRDEFDIVGAYLDIESLRFGERLKVTLDYPEEVGEALVPNFILQPLVENSIKHAVGVTGAPVSVTVSATRDGGDLVLAVEDDGPGLAPSGKRGAGGIGMENTRSRMRIRYGSAGSVQAEPTQRGFRTVIRLPYMTTADVGHRAGRARETLTDAPGADITAHSPNATEAARG